MLSIEKLSQKLTSEEVAAEAQEARALFNGVPFEHRHLISRGGEDEFVDNISRVLGQDIQMPVVSETTMTKSEVDAYAKRVDRDAMLTRIFGDRAEHILEHEEQDPDCSLLKMELGLRPPEPTGRTLIEQVVAEALAKLQKTAPRDDRPSIPMGPGRPRPTITPQLLREELDRVEADGDDSISSLAARFVRAHADGDVEGMRRVAREI